MSNNNTKQPGNFSRLVEFTQDTDLLEKGAVQHPQDFNKSNKDTIYHLLDGSLTCFEYQSRLISYTTLLKKLLDNPPDLEVVCITNEDFHRQVDNYLSIIGDLINGIYEMKQLNEN